MKNLKDLFMIKQSIKRKYIFLGDIDSINIEIIVKSFNKLKDKISYVIICNKLDFLKNNFFKKNRLKINEIYDPINFQNYKKNNLNIFDISHISKKKYLNLINQIKVANSLAKITGYDLVTMPINKTVFKKKIQFTGMTEYLGKINDSSTIMLMHGDKFSIIPLTTHINLKKVYKSINSKNITFLLNVIFNNIDKSIYNLNFNHIKFLCHNPHCGEGGTLGKEDILLRKILKKFKKIEALYPADSVFNKIEKKTLFLSTYHDQALIPFKILNKKSINLTLGLNYRRISPAHGTAKDIKNKFIADNTSYLTCLLY